MKAGTQVRIAGTTLEGSVLKRRINEVSDDEEMLVAWTNPDGEQHERWFSAAQLEVVEATQ